MWSVYKKKKIPFCIRNYFKFYKVKNKLKNKINW